MDQANQRKTDGQRGGARLWRAARTTSLLLGLGFMSVVLINPPGSSSASHDQPEIAFVPASGPWIKLGVDQSDAQRAAAIVPDNDITAQSEETKLRRPSRNSRSGIQLAKGSRMKLS